MVVGKLRHVLVEIENNADGDNQQDGKDVGANELADDVPVETLETHPPTPPCREGRRHIVFSIFFLLDSHLFGIYSPPSQRGVGGGSSYSLS